MRHAALRYHPDRGFSTEAFQERQRQYAEYCSLRDDWNEEGQGPSFLQKLVRAFNTLLGSFCSRRRVQQIEGPPAYIATVRVLHRPEDATNLVRHVADAGDTELVHDIHHGVPQQAPRFLEAVYTHNREEAATSLDLAWNGRNLVVTPMRVAGQSPLVSLQLVRGIDRSMYEGLEQSFVSADLNAGRGAASLILLGLRRPAA